MQGYSCCLQAKLHSFELQYQSTEYSDMIPANGHSQGLRRGGTWTDHFRLQTMRLKNIQEGITRRHRPWKQTIHTNVINSVDTVKNTSVHSSSSLKRVMQDYRLTWVCSISHNKHTYGGQVGVPLVLVGHHGPVEITAFHQGYTCYQGVRQICYIWCTWILYLLFIII